MGYFFIKTKKQQQQKPQKRPREPLAGPQTGQGYSSARKLNTAALGIHVKNVDSEAKAGSLDKTTNQKENRQPIYWQTSINDQRPKLKIILSNIELEGMVDTGADVTAITRKSWPPLWPLQEVDIQFQGVGTLSQVKQSVRWLKCTGPEGQIGKLRPYVADTTINLWGRDLLHQWKTQINIPSILETCQKTGSNPDKEAKIILKISSRTITDCPDCP